MTALAASNHRIRRLRRLSGRRSARSDEGAFLIEGPTLVAEALGSEADIEGLYVDEGLYIDKGNDGSVDVAELVTAAARRGVPVHRVAPGVLVGITDTVTPRHVLVVAALPHHPVEAVVDRAADRHLPLVVLVDVRDPGNVGTIIRAADASGVAGVLCSVGTVDPWSPKVVRSSAGAVLHLPVATGVDLDHLLHLLARRGVATVATVVDGGVPYDRAELGGAVAVVLGNEASGLDPAVVDRLDRAVTIPMRGRAGSLNVAMAASVLCFEAARQRDHRRPADSDWTPPPTDDKVNRP